MLKLLELFSFSKQSTYFSLLFRRIYGFPAGFTLKKEKPEINNAIFL